MTYLATDVSRQDGRPVELYRFTDGATVWAYCSGDVPTPYNGDNYLPVAITRGANEASGEFGKAQLNVTIPYDVPLAVFLAGGIPVGNITLTLFRAHLGDGEFVTYWRGRIVSANWRGESCNIVLEPVFTSMQRAGLRAVYQRPCRHALYSTGCGVNRATFAVPAVITTAVDNQLICSGASAFANHYFTGGLLTMTTGSRLIVEHIGTSLTLIAPLPGMTGGTAITLYPGCAHTLDDCRDKFSNAINFGGQPWIPSKNPFSGDAIV